ncbi:MAG: SelT/SelW/SelH family protein [Verrucomicrobiota bacterium]|nr:SelT/SelW/SelH family protein [Verrucomicrobiota bacterium]
MKFKILIKYCPGCRWLLRSSWMAQEILTTFENEINEVTLKPCKDKTGVFQISCNQELIWCREIDRGFPAIKELKQRIRDFVDPEKELGHLDL